MRNILGVFEVYIRRRVKKFGNKMFNFEVWEKIVKIV